MMTKISKIAEVNLSAITDERGDLLIDPGDRRPQRNGMRVDPPVGTPLPAGRRPNPTPAPVITLPRAIILMVLISALMYQIVSYVGTSGRKTSPTRTIQRVREVEPPPPVKEEKQPRVETGDKSLKLPVHRNVEPVQKPPEKLNSAPPQVSANKPAVNGDSQPPQGNLQVPGEAHKADARPAHDESVKHKSMERQASAQPRQDAGKRERKTTGSSNFHRQRQGRNTLPYRENAQNVETNTRTSVSADREAVKPVQPEYTKPAPAVEQQAFGEPRENRWQQGKETPPSPERNLETSREGPRVRQREPRRPASTAYRVNSYPPQGDVRWGHVRQTLSGSAGDWESSRQKVIYEDKRW